MASSRTDNKDKKVKTNKKNTKNKVVNKEGYFKGIKKEMKLVKWPTFKEVIKYSIATIVFCVIICLFFILLYFLLTLVVGEI